MGAPAGLDYRRGWENRDLNAYALASGLAPRLAAIVEAVSGMDARKVLEVGSGPGFVARAIRERLGIFAAATDLAPAFDSRLAGSCVVSDARAIPFRDASFDVVIASEVLEHLDVDAFRTVSRELVRVAARFVIVTVPHLEPLSVELVTCLECRTQFNSAGHLRSVSDALVTEAFGKPPSRRVPIGSNRTPPSGSGLLLSLLRWGLNPSWEPGEFNCPLCRSVTRLDTPDRSLRAHLYLRSKALLHRVGSERPDKMLYVFET